MATCACLGSHNSQGVTVQNQLLRCFEHLHGLLLLLENCSEVCSSCVLCTNVQHTKPILRCLGCEFALVCSEMSAPCPSDEIAMACSKMRSATKPTPWSWHFSDGPDLLDVLQLDFCIVRCLLQGAWVLFINETRLAKVHAWWMGLWVQRHEPNT